MFVVRMSIVSILFFGGLAAVGYAAEQGAGTALVGLLLGALIVVAAWAVIHIRAMGNDGVVDYTGSPKKFQVIDGGRDDSGCVFWVVQGDAYTVKQAMDGWHQPRGGHWVAEHVGGYQWVIREEKNS